MTCSVVNWGAVKLYERGCTKKDEAQSESEDTKKIRNVSPSMLRAAETTLPAGQVKANNRCTVTLPPISPSLLIKPVKYKKTSFKTD